MKFTLSFVVAALLATVAVSDIADAHPTPKHPKGIKHPKGFCASKGLKANNGTQVQAGFCSDTAQGEVPSVDNMVSTLILAPPNGGKVLANKPFDVTVQTRNLITGHFSDPANGTYYTQSQQLQGGKILGHNHITVQFLGNAKQDPDPKIFAFFQGLNNASNGQGKLTQTVTPIKQVGLYRICTMTSSFTHQPLLMPVAKRGSQDDCIRIDIVNKI